jgi:cell division protein ZapA
MMKNAIRLEILGREYTVKSDEGEERVKKIGEYVNQKIQEIAEGAKTISTLNVAILAALNIANDYFQSLEKQNEITRTVQDKSGRLIEMIHSTIKEG